MRQAYRASQRDWSWRSGTRKTRFPPHPARPGPPASSAPAIGSPRRRWPPRTGPSRRPIAAWNPRDCPTSRSACTASACRNANWPRPVRRLVGNGENHIRQAKAVTASNPWTTAAGRVMRPISAPCRRSARAPAMNCSRHSAAAIHKAARPISAVTGSAPQPAAFLRRPAAPDARSFPAIRAERSSRHAWRADCRP